MSILRSEDMGYFTLIMPHESAWVTLNQLGKINALQFVDLNAQESVFNRNYATYIKRCEEIERKIRFFEGEQKRFGIAQEAESDIPNFLKRSDEFLKARDSPPQTYLEELERDLGEAEASLLSQLDSHEKSLSHFVKLKEQRCVLEKTREFFLSRSGLTQGRSLFNHMTGVIKQSDVTRFKRMVFRASRGNALTEIMEIDQPFLDVKTQEKVEKAVFLVLYRDGETEALKRRLTKISDSFGGRIFQIPQSYEDYDKLTLENKQEINQAEEVIKMSKQQVSMILENLAKPRDLSDLSLITEYKWFVLKDKAIYHYLNMFHQRGNVFYGECWCPLSMERQVRESMVQLDIAYPNLPRSQLKVYEGNSSWPAGKTPPSFFNLNEFTYAFQEIIDTYGTPNYKEANPALFSIFTFPFLFGMMFGDIGHGSFLTLFAAYICLAKDSFGPTHLLRSAVQARYLLLLMGICSMYNGLIYNDMLSTPLNLFDSRWQDDRSETVYPFGIDPEWYLSEYNLLFFNSFKMKISVIFGVIQMICGTLFRGANTIQFGSAIDFFFEFIPQLIFTCSLFGYMIIMIFIKWSIDWEYNHQDNAPNLITVFMNMFLKMGSLDDQPPLWDNASEQENLQFFLLMLGLISVPIMLLPKPLILKYRAEKAAQEHGLSQLMDLDESNQRNAPEPEEFNFGEVMIHQAIETIEFTLAAVSNTASYLRLWALSLAHAQLSEVFFEKAVISTAESENPFMLVIGFLVFINVTIGVLMCMDAMECFLHALRLHWVEFMGKFYTGEGKKFEPLSFVTVLRSGKLQGSS